MNWIKYKDQPLINLDNIDTIDDKTIDCLMFYGTGSDEASRWKFENSAERDKAYLFIQSALDTHNNLWIISDHGVKSDG